MSRRIAATGLAAFMVAALALPAVAESHTIDFDIRQRRGPVENYVAQEATPAALVGFECVVTVETGNNHSVHDTDVAVRSNSDVVRVDDMESTPNLTRTATDTLTLGETVAVIVYAHDNGATSISGTVTLDCKPPETTTTTTQETTTTWPGITTTSSIEMTTTSSSTTTTNSLPTTTSIATSSTVISTTSTSLIPPATSSTTTAPTGSSTTPSTLPTRLPDTGVSAEGVAVAALVLLALGGAVVGLTGKTVDYD